MKTPCQPNTIKKGASDYAKVKILLQKSNNAADFLSISPL